MSALSSLNVPIDQFAPTQLRGMIASFLSNKTTNEERVAAILSGLESPMGQSLRDAMARWIVDEIVPVDRLVPEAYVKWRPPVRDAMMFVVARLSPSRLAPKLLEQLELPAKTSPEVRLLRLIAKVPGLQKLGQVIGRNQHLRPALRRALARLENGIRDVKPEDIRAIIRRDLGPRLKSFEVETAPTILSEASVSAVVRFTWRNPETGRRERGVFKVLKPHIPEYFAEDMDYLQKLAQYFGDRHRNYGFPAHLIPDTFRKVRRLLQHEVNFRREQRTLVEAWKLYRDLPGVRVPGVIKPLCTSKITALTEERGVKVTNAASRLPAPHRKMVAERIIEALVAVPLLSSAEESVFHGDPHPGNLLYHAGNDELVIIDWALRERLSREQRRHLALLFLMVSLRDPVGACTEVLSLSQKRIRNISPQARVAFEEVREFLAKLPIKYVPTPADAMRLLERIALKGLKFPGALIMLSKVMFTLEGLLGDIDNSGGGMGFGVALRVAQDWMFDRKAYRFPLIRKDWISLQCSALLYAPRLWLQCEEAVLDRLLPASEQGVHATAENS